MHRLVLGVLVTVLFLPPPVHGAAGARCLRASGVASARCLADYTATVAHCRRRADSTCEADARAEGGTLAAVLVRPEASDRRACADADADALSGAFLGCQRVAAVQLGRLRAATVRLFGPGCYLRERQGHRCARAGRDQKVAHARAAAERAIVRRCGARLATVGLAPLAPVLDRTVTHARHYAQQVYPPNDRGPTAEFGPFPVGIRTLTLDDPARRNVAGTGPRPVTVEVYYPSTVAAVAGVARDVVTVLGVEVVTTPSYRNVAIAAGPHPLMVFSHGNNGIRIQSFFFAAHLASHGFVVVSPDHHGNTFVDTLLGVVDPEVATNRPRDLTFVIDRFLAFGDEAGNFFAGAIDPARIGASGHSFGGFTVLALAGGTSPLGTFTDARVKAVLPQAPATTAYPDAYFQTIHVPTLLVGGSLDETTPFAGEQQRPFDLLPAGAAVVALAQVRDAGHFTFSDFCEVDRRLLGFLGGFAEACEPRTTS